MVCVSVSVCVCLSVCVYGCLAKYYDKIMTTIIDDKDQPEKQG